MPDETLMILARDVRGKTLKLLDGLSDADAQFATLNNSILWHAGHACIVVEHLSLVPLLNQPAADPPGWFDAFSWKSIPATVTTWPSVEQVRTQLQEQLTRLLNGLESTSEADLAKVVNPKNNRTLRWSILHGLHDEANHQGEIYLLKKMLAKSRS
jgi:hypothetical protein